MPTDKQFSNFLGLDIGQTQTRAAFFGITERKYRLLGFGMAPTSLGLGMHLSLGAGQAIRKLQEKAGYILIKPSGSVSSTMDGMNQNVDRVGWVTSVGPRMKAAVLGLSAQGSVDVGRILLESLPLNISGLYGLAELGDEAAVIDQLITSHPEILIISGGEDGGDEKHLIRWIEVARLFCLLLPQFARPLILYAGNPAIHDVVQRRLEPVCQLSLAPNIQPGVGELDLVPSQAVLDAIIIRHWSKQTPGFGDMVELPNSKAATTSFALGRTVRYLSQTVSNHPNRLKKSGVLAVDIGGAHSMLITGMDGKSGSVLQPCCDIFSDIQEDTYLQSVQNWSLQPVSLDEVRQYLSNYVLRQGLIPQTLNELAILQAWARVRMQYLLSRVAMNTNWLPYHPGQGLIGHFEPIIASGSVLTHTPTPGQAMLMLLDGLQPRNVTTIVLDTHHLLPQLGLIAEDAPILPVHVLKSDAFTNLATVIVAVSDVAVGEPLLTVRVRVETGKDYSVTIVKGTLRRLVIPKDVPVVLEIEPRYHTDVGFGGPGLGGRLKVPGGVLGVVIDARGRPLQLPEDHEIRAAQLTRWLWNLGG